MVPHRLGDSSKVSGRRNRYAERRSRRRCGRGRLLAEPICGSRDVPGDFVDAFDDHALAIYRAAVADLDRQHAGRDHWSRFEVDAMLLELADHDGDVDRAVDLLNDGEHPRYGAIIARLREAGRADEVVKWIGRAVAEGRISGQGGGNEAAYGPRLSVVAGGAVSGRTSKL